MVAILASLSATAVWPGRRLLLLGGLAGRQARHALSDPARWAVLSAIDAALLGADAALTSPLTREAVRRVLTSPVADDVVQQLVAQIADSPDLQRLGAQVFDSPALERLLEKALDSPEAERLASRVIDSRLVDVIVQRLLANDGLWVLIDEIAQSPSVTAAISHQGAGFASQMADVARDRSRTADDRLERLAARLTRRLPRPPARPSEEPVA